MGGMQVLEWAVMFPHRVRSIVPIATCAAATAQQIALERRAALGDRARPEVARRRLLRRAAPGDGPHRGLALARAIAQITYRSDDGVQRPVRSRAASIRMDDVSRCGSASTSRDTSTTTAQARPPLRRQLVPRHQQGDGPARHRPRTRRLRGAVGRIDVPIADDRASTPTSLYSPTSRKQIRDALRRPRHARRARRDRQRRTATTRSCSRPIR